jgi:hypothetical protein
LGPIILCLGGTCSIQMSGVEQFQDERSANNDQSQPFVTPSLLVFDKRAVSG